MMPKFRAWDKQFKIIGEVTEIWFSKVQQTLVKYRIEHTNGKKEDVWSHIDDNGFGTCVLMQATGLKDKNGVEIYEGDIVKNSKGEVGYIAYLQQESGFVVVLKKRDYRLGHRNTGELYDAANEHQVIGNIYENPELLEVGE